MAICALEDGMPEALLASVSNIYERLMSKPLVLPKGISLSPLPDADSPFEISESNKLEEQFRSGYIVHETDDELFDYFIEMNVDANKVWGLFYELVQAILPEDFATLIGQIGESALFLTEYADKDEVLDTLSNYSYELANDCNLQFGAVYQDEDLLEEVLVTPSKSFRIWTNQLETLQAVVESLGIPLVEELYLVEEYAQVSAQPLGEGVSCSVDIVTRITERFGVQNDFIDHEQDH